MMLIEGPIGPSIIFNLTSETFAVKQERGRLLLLLKSDCLDRLSIDA
jgi:hypothetical protein